jgi:polysaccharide biosynthesis protein PslG
MVLAIGVLVWIAVAAVVLVELDDQTPRPPGHPAPLPERGCRSLAIGVNATLAFEGDPRRRAAVISAIDEKLGAQLVRDSLLWDRIEPVEGRRDWTIPDRVIEDLRAAGIEPLLVVLGSPSWANGVPPSTPDHQLYVPPRGPALEAWLQRYSDFLTAAVRRYHRFVRRWEIWNEPNLAHFWHPQPDPLAYRQVYESLRATIKSVDPTAQVAVGGVGSLVFPPPSGVSGLQFLQRLTGEYLPVDHVGVHAYTTNDHPPDVDVPGGKNFTDIDRVYDQLVAEGGDHQLWVTEWGWSSVAVG